MVEKNYEEYIIYNKRKINLSDINPFIRKASKHKLEEGLKTGVRINRHYQLHYICSGEGEFTFGKKTYRAKAGDLLIWPPALTHIIESNKKDPMIVIGIQFDMTHKFKELIYPCIHYTKETFCENLINEYIELIEIDEIPIYIPLKENIKIEYYLKEIVKLFRQQSPYSNDIISGLLKTVLIIAIENDSYGFEYYKNGKASVQEIVQYLANNYKKRISNKEIGHHFNYHPNYLNKLVINYTGMTVQQYLINIRINKSIDLLQHTSYSISEIAEEVGGYNIHYFSRLFKIKTGINPSSYR